jgi:RNA polymerase sigma-70 factor, ECF subfamily
VDFEQTLQLAQAGDQRAIGALYRELNPLLRRFFAARARDAADDLAQDTWLSVSESLAGFEGDERGFRSWFFTIAYRRLADHHRRASRLRETTADPDVLVAMAPGVEQDDRASMEAALHDLVDGLSTDQADIVLLRVVVGLDVDQVAEIVGKRPGAVRVAQHRALRQIASRVVPLEAAG